MGKGKRKTGISGLSQFLDALNGAASDTHERQNAAPDPPTERPPKKRKPDPKSSASAPAQTQEGRKPGLLGPGYEKYDATGLVPHYTTAEQVPTDLQKYFYQRNRYFSLYSSGCLLDREGWYSVTPEVIANRIAERCRCDVVLDAFCGVGGNAIAFAQTCERVIALDNSETRLKLARHNAHIYGVADRIEFVLADYPSFVRAQLALPQAARRPIDVVFLSPPWGGPGYLYDAPAAAAAAAADEVAQPAECAEYRLSAVLPIPGYDLWHMTRRITKNVAFFLPRNVCIEDVAKLTDVPEQSTTVLETENEEGRGQEMIEIEEEWMGTKLKAVTCYFGGLVAGQEDLFDVC